VADKPKAKLQKLRLRLTERQRRFLDAKLAGKNDMEAALAARYSPANPSQSAYQAKKALERMGDEVYRALGLTKTEFIQKHLAPCLEATETKVFWADKRVVYSGPMVAWGPRLRAVHMVFQLAGDYIGERANENPASQIKVVMSNGEHRPPQGIEARVRPALGEPETKQKS
jgi:hypothetical protein